MAEVVAIRQAVKYTIGRQLKQAKIIADSLSALMSLASVHERRVIINKVKDNIKEYSGDIQLIWIRAHRGFERNESADELAKMASTKDHVEFYFVLLKSKLNMPPGRKFWRNGKNVGQVVLNVDEPIHC
ncbi:hypothetical protein AVEN_265027-1 [Araneus ventricosus]|uniref:RNase H type-1 domain-containing protein n=1 Tax=Araneus ventricosus TaxID=182803 RepID=A0A4Y2EK95_ARAVE|nr:hypothetical protein AVEN_265027-1 [Araneus ventricosus]